MGADGGIDIYDLDKAKELGIIEECNDASGLFQNQYFQTIFGHNIMTVYSDTESYCPDDKFYNKYERLMFMKKDNKITEEEFNEYMENFKKEMKEYCRTYSNSKRMFKNMMKEYNIKYRITEECYIGYWEVWT